MDMKLIFFLVFSIATLCIAKPQSRPLSQELIDHVNSAGTTWTAGHNARFANVPISAVKSMLGSLPSKVTAKDYLSAPAVNVDDLPTNFDARDKWPKCKTIMSEIRDQGACADCWAVAAAAAISDRICIGSDGTKQVHISAEDINDCCGTVCGFGCAGGYALQAWQYWVTSGIVTGGNFNDTNTGCLPYSIPPCEHHGTPGHLSPCTPNIATPTCVPKCAAGYNKQYAADKNFGKSAYAVKRDEASIRAEIYANGPVETTITVYADFVAYKTGVYQHVTGAALGLHSMKIYGWGVDSATNTPYWLVANTWNEDWGQNGFLKHIRGKDDSGIEDSVFAGLPK